MPRRFAHLPGYEVIRRIGKGAGAVIYEARSAADRSLVAIKHVVRKGPRDDRFVEQAENEYQICRELDHPALRQCFDLVRVRRWLKTHELFLIMELGEGQTLEDMLQHQPPPDDLSSIVRIFVDVAGGLAAMHRKGYVHADIKPNNILVCGSGAKVIDFGQSCPLGHVKQRIQGTPDFIAPEQVRRNPIDHRTDIFNLGASMYWAVTGKWFRTMLNVGEAASRIIEMDARSGNDSPEVVNPRVPIALARLIMECCATHPLDRPQDMRQVISRLETALHLLRKKKAEASSG